MEVVDLTDDGESSVPTSGGHHSAHRSKLSSTIAEVDEELKLIDKELTTLKQRKVALLKKKESLLSQVEASETDYRQVEEQFDTDGFGWSKDAEKTLKEVFHLSSFRPLQRAAINAVMSGEDVIVIMSTGAGKSLCYQLPAVLSKGLTLVVSPLVSLVEDQLQQLAKLNIPSATLNANTSKEEVKQIETHLSDPKSPLRLLYVTPEKLAKSKRIMNKLEKASQQGIIKLIAVDEVHCCSQWGNDFRPDYKFLNVLKRQFKGVPLLGLTATATGNVLDDVKKMLGIEAAIVFKAGFNRPNLRYEVLDKEKSEMGLGIASMIKKRFAGQSGIVYCFSRKDCETVAQTLRENGVRAHFYHAYMEPDQKTKVHQKWTSGQCQVIVATVAFGMGIDKPDVRFVIHHSIPKSIENYYQESGRAGRDGGAATCVLLFRLGDVFRQSTMVCTEQTGCEKLYQMVAFAAEDSKCRRMSLAGYFNEDWEPGWCQGGCDVCSHPSDESPSSLIDLSKELRLAVQCINESLASAKEGGGRVTGAKLVELMGKKLTRGRDFLEAAVTHMLLANMLTEDFHFTPYSIVSYVVVGRSYAKWLASGGKFERRIRSGGQKKAKKRAMVDSDDDVG